MDRDSRALLTDPERRARELVAMAEQDETYTIGTAMEFLRFGKFQTKLMFLTGCCWLADAFEVMVLSFLSPIIACEWHLTGFQEALLSTVVFIGMLFGASTWGTISDRFGRRKGYLGAITFTFIFGAFSAIAPNFALLLLCRGLVGFGVSGGHVAYSLLAEFTPVTNRGTYLCLSQFFWSAGALLNAGLAWAVLPTLGWRWFLALAAVPAFFLLVFYPLLPESPRWLVVAGRTDEAERLLASAARTNGTSLPRGRLVAGEAAALMATNAATATEGNGHFRDLVAPSIRKTTCMLWFIWFANAFVYYGMVLLVPQLQLQEDIGNRCGHDAGELQNAEFPSQRENCNMLTDEEFLNIFLVTGSELPAIPLALLLLQKLGRKRTMAVFFAGTVAFALLLFACSPRSLETFLFAMARISISSAYGITYIYTPEVYPTSIRSTGLGFCSSVARIGGISTPFVAVVVLRASAYLSLGIYATVALVASILAALLPIETSAVDIPDVLPEQRKRIAKPA